MGLTSPGNGGRSFRADGGHPNSQTNGESTEELEIGGNRGNRILILRLDWELW